MGLWRCVYASKEIWMTRLGSKLLIRELIQQLYDQTQEAVRDQNEIRKDISFVYVIAKALDAWHSLHTTIPMILAYPLYASVIIKKKLISLGYEANFQKTDDTKNIDGNTAMDIMRQIFGRADRETKCYYEVSFSENAHFQFGYNVFNMENASDMSFDKSYYRSPGDSATGFGFGVNGNIYYGGEEYPYMENLGKTPLKDKTFGVLVNFHTLSIHLVREGEMGPPAFGMNSIFSPKIQAQQAYMIKTHPLVPCFALKLITLEKDKERAFIRVNFGDRKFLFNVNSASCDNHLAHLPSKAVDSIVITDSATVDPKLKQTQDEEYSLQMMTEKNFIKSSIFQDALKSFSLFPPSNYRRSMATTIIQKAWRRYKGRKERANTREKQRKASQVIQRMVRIWLKRIREYKSDSALKIQRFWRIKCFIWKALLRCIYRRPLSILNHAAKIIQGRWKRYRAWKVFKQSPFAFKYNAKLEDIENAVHLIVEWWRPRFARLKNTKRGQLFNVSARVIQSVYRGYRLRRQLRPDLRRKLKAVGAMLITKRVVLLQTAAAFVIQKFVRRIRTRKVREGRINMRNYAATKIQAAFRGYWIRAYIKVRFNYGEAIYLMAVGRSLMNCHYILKMYKPCGIVCPTRQTTGSQHT